MTAPDLVQTIVDFFNGGTGWDKTLTNNRDPHIFCRDMEKRSATANQDIVYVYDIVGDMENVSNVLEFRNREDVVGVQFITQQGRDQKQKMQTEVERLLTLMKKQPTTKPAGAQYDVIEEGGWKALISYKDFWKLEMKVTGYTYWETR